MIRKHAADVLTVGRKHAADVLTVGRKFVDDPVVLFNVVNHNTMGISGLTLCL
jgi:hypothetical protein